MAGWGGGGGEGNVRGSVAVVKKAELLHASFKKSTVFNVQRSTKIANGIAHKNLKKLKMNVALLLIN